jgi:hypothetical protein
VAVFRNAEFICMARCPILEDVPHAEVAARGLAIQRAADKALRAAQRAARRLTSRTAVANAIVDERVAAAPNVQRLQTPEYVTTPALEAAVFAGVAEAVEAEAHREGPPAVRVLDLPDEQVAAIKAQMGRPRAEDPKDMFYRLLGMPDSELTAEQREWRDWYGENDPAGQAILAHHPAVNLRKAQ